MLPGTPLSNAISEEFVLSSWREGHTSLGGTTHDKMKQIDQVFGLVAIVIGLAVNAAESKDLRWVYLILPSLVLIVVTYTLRNYQEIVAIGIYRKHLETIIATRVGFPLMQWEHFSPRWNHYSLANLFSFAGAGLVSVGVVALGSVTAMSMPPPIPFVYYSVTFGMLLIVFIAGFELSRKAGRVERDLSQLRSMHGLDRPPVAPSRALPRQPDDHQTVKELDEP